MGKTILCVEDNVETLRLLTMTLQLNEYKTAKAGNGQEALDVVAALKPDLILMDLMMPVMTGTEAVEQLRANEETEAIPIIILSALPPYDERMDRAFEGGANAYVAKPIDTDTLLKTIQHQLFLGAEGEQNGG